MVDDNKLLRDLKKHKKASLEKLISRYTPYVHTITYNIIGHIMAKEDIEEVIADTFISLWKSVEHIDSDKGSLKAYIGTIAKNTAKNKLRQHKMSYELSEEILSKKISIEDYFLQKEKDNHLLQVIKNLGEIDSEIFVRYYFYEEKIKDIAKYTGVCSATIKTKLARGRIKLKKDLTNKEEYYV